MKQDLFEFGLGCLRTLNANDNGKGMKPISPSEMEFRISLKFC